MDNLIDSFEAQDSGKEIVKGWRLVLGYAGFFMMLIGIVILVPLFTLIFYPSEAKYWASFVIPGVLCVLIGAVPFFLFNYKRRHGQLATHQDAFIVVLCWLIAILACAFPFATSGLMNFHQAIFESASGITTCGLSIVSDYETFPHIFFILRSMTHLVGGIGLVLVMISALSDRYGMKLYASEGHYDRFMPNLLKSSRAILLIYVGFIVAGVIGYVICGMPLFDAINHSIAAVATGGFSTHAESIGFYNSLPIEIVSIVLMLCGSTNFLAHVFLFRGKLKNFFNYCENKLMYLMYAILIPVVSMGIFYASTFTMGESFRSGIFHTISAMSTTGFQLHSFDVNVTPSILLIVVIFCMLLGGQSNSTAGGFKTFRLNLVFRSIYIKIKESLVKTKTVHCYRISQLDEDQYITDRMISDNNVFMVTWILLYLFTAIVFTLFNIPMAQAFFEAASILGTSGLSTGAITAASPTFLFYFSSLIMLLGRLEVFVVFYGVVFSIRAPIAKAHAYIASKKEN